MEIKDQPIDPSQVPQWRSRLEQIQVKLQSIRDLAHVLRGWEERDDRRIDAIHKLATDCAELAALPEGEETGWPDIASAPKDATEVLGWEPVNGYNIVWCSTPASRWRQAGGAFADPQPTHWRPLPPPPADRTIRDPQ